MFLVNYLSTKEEKD
jgi:calcium-dependent protein kinase